MSFVIESVDNWQKVMMFIGRNIDYQAAYLPNLPMWSVLFDGRIEGMKLVVATRRDEHEEIVACCVRQVFTDDVQHAKTINPDFQPVVWVGDFGAVSPELSDFTEQIARQYVYRGD